MTRVNNHFVYWEKCFFVLTVLATQLHFLHSLLLDASLCECYQSLSNLLISKPGSFGCVRSGEIFLVWSVSWN